MSISKCSCDHPVSWYWCIPKRKVSVINHLRHCKDFYMWFSRSYQKYLAFMPTCMVLSQKIGEDFSIMDLVLELRRQRPSAVQTKVKHTSDSVRVALNKPSSRAKVLQLIRYSCPWSKIYRYVNAFNTQCFPFSFSGEKRILHLCLFVIRRWCFCVCPCRNSMSLCFILWLRCSWRSCRHLSRITNIRARYCSLS